MSLDTGEVSYARPGRISVQHPTLTQIIFRRLSRSHTVQWTNLWLSFVRPRLRVLRSLSVRQLMSRWMPATNWVRASAPASAITVGYLVHTISDPILAGQISNSAPNSHPIVVSTSFRSRRGPFRFVPLTLTKSNVRTHGQIQRGAHYLQKHIRKHEDANGAHM